MTEQIQMSTDEITQFAFQMAQIYGTRLDIPPILYDAEHWNPIVRNMLLEAHNPNGIMIVAKNHDEQVAVKLKDGWRYGPLDINERTHPELLPFLQLPPERRAKAIFFRQTVVSLQQFWTQQ